MKNYIRNIWYNLRNIILPAHNVTIIIGEEPPTLEKDTLYFPQKAWDGIVEWSIQNNMTVEQTIQAGLKNGIKEMKKKKNE